MEPSPLVTVVILNWNAQTYLEACLRSVLAQEGISFQVWLVDNHSSDDSVSFVQTHFPQVHLWPLAENRGFSGGNNAVLRQVQTPLVVLLNPDVVVEANWLKHLVQPLLTDRTVGIVGGKLFYGDGRLQHVGGLIHSPQALAGYRGHLETDTGQYELITEATYVVGASLAFRRGLLDEVGLLDEGYFLYYEDADWCARVHRAGWRIVVAPQARLLHWESVLTGKGTFGYWRNFHRGRVRYLLKHFSPQLIIEETLAAEARWLAQVSQEERLAAANAYHYALTHLPSINKDRTQDGATPFTPTEFAQLTTGFLTLFREAWQTPHLAQAELLLQQQKQLAEVRPRAFTSPLPLLGPLIARVRTLWNQIETVAYVQPVRQQQDEVNQLITQISTHYLDRFTQRLPDYWDQMWVQMANLLQLRQEVQSLRQQLAETHKQLDRLAQKAKAS